MTRLLVFNVGSASLKAALFDARLSDLRAVARASLDLAPGEPPAARLSEALALLRCSPDSVDLVGHRIVHGGRAFSTPTLIDEQVEAEIERLAPLAPLHQAPALSMLRAARRLFPKGTHVAVFDTAFHAERPAVSLRYALPEELIERFSLFRFGFHGIAHQSLIKGFAREVGEAASQIRAVTLQLGQGCSACAIERGRSIETSMGFTPLEGLVMGTRSGNVDPGAVLHLLRSGVDVDHFERVLLHQSGLLALAGTSDMRHVLAAVGRRDARAEQALEIFVHRIVLTVGGYLTLLGGGADLIFGGGIGENSALVRARVVARLGAWGMELDAEANARGTPGPISRLRSGAPRVYVVRTDEERVIAQLVARAVGA